MSGKKEKFDTNTGTMLRMCKKFQIYLIIQKNKPKNLVRLSLEEKNLSSKFLLWIWIRMHIESGFNVFIDPDPYPDLD
jgi:hypothetical protein